MIHRTDEERSATRALRRLGFAACAGVASVAFFACSGPKDGQVFVGTFPSAETFQPVSAALEARCGTLDCHGSFYRNLRMFGMNGIRGTVNEVSGVHATTDEEVLLNYESLVSIQPEQFSNIVSHRGQGFDKWIVVTKGTGAEHHQGSSRFAKGDLTYTCLLSWVTGSVNMDACTESATSVMRPGGEPTGTDVPPDTNQPQP
jgi:hypothetical protein